MRAVISVKVGYLFENFKNPKNLNSLQGGERVFLIRGASKQPNIAISEVKLRPRPRENYAKLQQKCYGKMNGPEPSFNNM